MRAYDAVVAGLGGMGSALVAALAQRGLRVLGLDARRPPHDRGSTHGGSRIIRKVYFEAPFYVPLLELAYRSWRDLERASKRTLLTLTGGLSIGSPRGRLVDGARRSADLHGVAVEHLVASEVRYRFPALVLPPDAVAVYDPEAGVLDPEECVHANLELARRLGAELRFGDSLTAWQSRGDDVVVRSSRGKHATHRLFLALGAWLQELVRTDELVLGVERAVQHWFQPEQAELCGPEDLPLFVWEYDADRIWYGIPDLGAGVKAALHYQGEKTTAAGIDRQVAPSEIAAVRTLLDRYLPAASGAHLRSSACLYTNTPDLHFVVDAHPQCRAVQLVSACSGHGFKFCGVIADCLAREMVGEAAPADLSPFRLHRFR